MREIYRKLLRFNAIFYFKAGLELIFKGLKLVANIKFLTWFLITEHYSLEKCVRIGNDKQLKNDWNYCNEILLCESCKKSKANIVFQT